MPAAIAGATLWSTRFRGKLKGVIAATGPTGKPAHDAERAFAPRLDVHRQELAADSGRLFRGEAKSDRGAVGFGLRVPPGLARFGHDRFHVERPPRAEIRLERAKDRGAAVRREPRASPGNSRRGPAIARSTSGGPARAARASIARDCGERTSIQSPVTTSPPAIRSGRSGGAIGSSDFAGVGLAAGLFGDPSGELVADRPRERREAAIHVARPLVRQEEGLRALLQGLPEGVEPRSG